MNALHTFWKRIAPKEPVIVQFGRHSASSDEAALFAGSRLLPAESETAAQSLSSSDIARFDLLHGVSHEDLQQNRELLFRQRIDAILSGGDAPLCALLAYHSFSFFVASGDQIRRIAPGEAHAHAAWLAVHERFASSHLPNDQLLDLPALFKRYSVEPRGVIHIGAHDGEEFDLYVRMGFKRVLFFEANPAVYARLTARLGNINGVMCILCAISDTNGMEVLHVTSSDESSSLLPLKLHAEIYPEIREQARVLIPTRSLDFILRELGVSAADYNFLHLDIQGAELKALRGAALTLPSLDAISCEVNYAELYEGCPLVEDLDDFLRPFAFERMFTATTLHPQWGDAFYLRQPAISFRELGRQGRFGNQVFQYAFLKLLAKRHRVTAQTSPWVGIQLFGTTDPLANPRRPFPQHAEVTESLAESHIANAPFRPVNLDITGIFQYHSSYYAPEKAYVQSLFQPVPALKKQLDDALTRVRGDARTMVALHLRRGDYGYGIFFLPPNQWYLDYLRSLWPALDNPFLYIATDEPGRALADFAEFSPVSARDLDVRCLGADYYPDFYALTQADAVAISNSSFSFAACMLNQRATRFMRPHLFDGRLIPFDPWNDEPLLHRELGSLDYRVFAAEIPNYLANPSLPENESAVREWRLRLAVSFSQVTARQLPVVLQMDLWQCYLQLRKANLRALPMIDMEKPHLQKILDRFARSGLDQLGPYIAATLFVPATHLPPVDLTSISRPIQEVLRS